MGISFLLLQGLFETVLMVFVATIISIALGLPLGIFLFLTSPSGLKPHRMIYQTLGFLVNATRSIPFIILMILMLPLTRFIIGSGIGTMASVLPLALGGLLLTARVVEDALLSVPKGLKEIGMSIGASTTQIVVHILLPDAFPSMISGLTLIIINLVGFSAMAGVMGGGGLGDLAIRYGYQRYDLALMVWIVLILVVIVQIIQFLGNYLAKHARR